jgi:DNA adenine methylase
MDETNLDPLFRETPRRLEPSKIPPPLKWHGGKTYLAVDIIALMPKHLHFVEPFFGGGAVLLAKSPVGTSEVANDIDGRLTNFWRVLQDPALFPRFHRIVEAIPFSEAEWTDAGERLDDSEPVVRAVAFFIRCRQSLAGRMDRFAPLSRTRTRRDMNEQTSAWMAALEGLPAVYHRLRRVAVLNRPAVEVIRSQDGPETLFYCDPPYLHSTRTARAVYSHEMTQAQHRELLNVLLRCTGNVMLSGYPSALYDDMLAGWTRHTFDRPNNAAGGSVKDRETEVLWCNFKGAG